MKERERESARACVCVRVVCVCVFARANVCVHARMHACMRAPLFQRVLNTPNLCMRVLVFVSVCVYIYDMCTCTHTQQGGGVQAMFVGSGRSWYGNQAESLCTAAPGFPGVVINHHKRAVLVREPG